MQAEGARDDLRIGELLAVLPGLRHREVAVQVTPARAGDVDRPAVVHVVVRRGLHLPTRHLQGLRRETRLLRAPELVEVGRLRRTRQLGAVDHGAAEPLQLADLAVLRAAHLHALRVEKAGVDAERARLLRLHLQDERLAELGRLLAILLEAAVAPDVPLELHRPRQRGDARQRNRKGHLVARHVGERMLVGCADNAQVGNLGPPGRRQGEGEDGYGRKNGK